MISVFQLYKKLLRIPKLSYTPEIRKVISEWDKELNSKTGYVENDILHLPIQYKDMFHLNRVGGILINDIIGYSSLNHEIELKKLDLPEWYKNNLKENFKEFIDFNKEQRIWLFEIFSIEKREKGDYELFLRYGANEFSIGKPKRNDHKLCTLKKGHPVRVLINGKIDSTMSSGSERTYSEYDFILSYLGEVESVEFKPPNKIEKQKQIPQSFTKSINERKILF